ncbi:MAG: hypothetical protein MUC99_05000 [Anaerolineae bacterium]|jgi:hypothetical protein|nr:hypothetical protein [Anaerolineae bacterium]
MKDHRESARAQVLTPGVLAAAAQAGCAAVVVVLLALFVGLWLDSLIGQRGLCTLGLIVSSVPLSLWLMVRIALRVVQNVPVVLPKPEPLEPLEEEE